MGNDLDHWASRLGELNLPAMALTMQRVPQLLDSPNTTNADYQRIISRDPGFTLAIFKSFSQHKFAPKEPPSNLAHAIAMLGLGPLEDSSKTLSILKETVNGRARHELYDCYSRAAHAAWYAYSLARYCNDNNPEEMAIAALLHELAEMMLWAHAKDKMQSITLLQERGKLREQAALDTLGFTLDELTAALAKQWRLPTLARETLELSGAFQTRSLGVMICTNLAQESAKSWESDETLELIEIAAEYQKRDYNKTVAAIHSVTAKAARDLSGLPLPLSAYDLLQMEAPQSKGTTQKAGDIKNRCPKTQQPQKQRRVVNQSKAPQKRPQPSQKKAVTANRTPLQITIQNTFTDLREGIELERILFATLSADKKIVKVKFAVGVSKESPLRKFRFNLGERNLFSILMKKPQSFWLNSKNKDKYYPLINDTLQPAVSEHGFFLTSIFVKGKPVGIIYADSQKMGGLTSTRFKEFKIVAQRLTNKLANLDSLASPS